MNLTHRARIVGPVLATVIAMLAWAGPAAAHSPDPRLNGTLWAPDQVLFYQWRSGQVPPTWMAGAIDAAAADASITRASRAATFARPSGSAPSLIAYGQPTGCSPAGLACFSRAAAPSSFLMWFRAHGYVFDWGTLRWCQAQTTFTDGCFDAETVALDEFGHVEILEHHANYYGDTDYLDAVVQTVSQARPKAGWQVHALARCDTARLQLEYDRPSPGALFSTCLAIGTTTTLAAIPTSITAGASVRFTATLRTANTSASGALANDPISGRAVLLQRRTVGASSWTTIASMTASTITAGSYSTTLSPTATYEWRGSFATPTNEGVTGSASAALKVMVSGGCSSGCLTRVAP